NVDLTKRNISTCGNPTFIAGQPNRNYLAEIAPQPPACDAVTSDPCAAGTALVANPTKSGQLPSTNGGATSTGTTGGRASTSGAAGTAAGGPAAGAVVPGTTTGTTDATQATTGLQPQPVAEAAPTELSAGRRPVSSAVLAPLAVLLLVAAVVAPPLLSRRLAAGDATSP
ncbi:MAG: phosphate transport system substrate-binding protein, partial [Solirubrobacteraceae bacterium]|nr:phosphate transport system substrate-binding protein [Solirubrobacteraceae bacterium]